MKNAAYELDSEARCTLSASDNTTTIDAFDDSIQAQTKALPFAMILGKAIAETELERADWDISDDVSETLRNLEWVHRASEVIPDIEAKEALARRKRVSRAWLVSICFSGITALSALAVVTGIPEDIQTLGIQPVLAETSTIAVEKVQAQIPVPRVIANKHQGRLQFSEPLPTAPPTFVVEDAAPTKMPAANEDTRFKVSSRF